tara:strand:- start:3003 stop:4052 length:1050 start_codon:yes stop_codon:yes gene_type:complete
MESQLANNKPWTMSEIFRLLWFTRRHGLAPFLAANVITVGVTTHQMDGREVLLVWAGLGLLALIVPPVMRLSKTETICLIVLGISLIGAIPLSLVFGEGRWILATLHAAWVIPWALLAYIPIDRDRILYFLSFPTMGQAGWVIGQGLFYGGRADGWTHSPNVVAGYLTFMCIWLTGSKSYLPAIICASAIPFTGSRLAMAVTVTVTGAMLIKQNIKWLPVFAACVGAAFVLASDYERYQPEVMKDSLEDRWAITRPLNLFPTGVIIQGAHNVPIRQAIETGIPSAIAWLILSALMLKKNRGALRWAAVGLLGLGIADYYIWLGSLCSLWFLLLGGNVWQHFGNKLVTKK